MEHESVVSRVEVGSPAEHDAVQYLQHPMEIVLVRQGRNRHRYPASLANRVVVTRAQDGEGGAVLASRAVVQIDPDERLRSRLVRDFGSLEWQDIEIVAFRVIILVRPYRASWKPWEFLS